MRKLLPFLLIIVLVIIGAYLIVFRTHQQVQQTNYKTPEQTYGETPAMSSSDFFTLVSKCQVADMAFTNVGFEFRSTVDKKVYKVTSGIDIESIAKAISSANASHKCSLGSPGIE